MLNLFNYIVPQFHLSQAGLCNEFLFRSCGFPVDLIISAINLYFVHVYLFSQDFLLPEVRDRQFLLGFHRKARKTGMDVDNYNSLKNRLHALESDLRRLRDPLALNLPPQRLAKIIAEDAAQSPLKSSTFSVLQDQLKSLLKIKH
ncbi:hypothetical protein HAZT_HAZT004152 [Hyalella azteca]|uniref:Uncharacterized protein n=1 Tax=Hyalella azteca TaxID=294128 RepID=A0A6A0H377_HYAAZ|nr:hypothetical protein HAZT_HAZT004152 [Hyalella azteca]